MAGETKRFAFVIPAYNHWPRVEGVVKEALQFGAPVFLVDDGSTDQTARELTPHRSLRILTHRCNQGKGAALITGMTAATEEADWAITLDADQQHNPRDAKALLEAVDAGNRGIVVGCRTGMDDRGTPWTSRWGRKFSNFWVWAAGGAKLSDSQSGFRLYPLPETIQLGAVSRRFQFEVEILVRAAWSKMPITEAFVSVDYHPPGNRVSHFRPWLDFWRNSLTFARLVIQRIVLPRRVRAVKGLDKS